MNEVRREGGFNAQVLCPMGFASGGSLTTDRTMDTAAGLRRGRALSEGHGRRVPVISSDDAALVAITSLADCPTWIAARRFAPVR